MNADQLEGKWELFSRNLKKQWGKFSDDDLLQIFTDKELLQIQGNYDKFLNKLEEHYGNHKEEVMKWADRWCLEQESLKAKPTEATVRTTMRS